MNTKWIVLTVSMAALSAALLWESSAEQVAASAGAKAALGKPVGGHAKAGASKDKEGKAESAQVDSVSSRAAAPASPGGTGTIVVTSSGAVAPSPLPERPLSSEERKALQKMATSLLRYVLPGSRDPQLMIGELAMAGLKPVVAKDVNDATGTMIQIRTEKSLPGIRYYHAQYFEDENKTLFPQHISFEVRPSGDGMREASAALEAALKAAEAKWGKLGTPITKTESLAEWRLKGGYMAWIKKMGVEDLENDRFNAHELPQDAGLYKVAIELIPEHHGDAKSGH